MKRAKTEKKKLLFVSGNQGKLREVTAILGDAGWDVALHPLDLDELQGTGVEIVR